MKRKMFLMFNLKCDLNNLELIFVSTINWNFFFEFILIY